MKLRVSRGGIPWTLELTGVGNFADEIYPGMVLRIDSEEMTVLEVESLEDAPMETVEIEADYIRPTGARKRSTRHWLTGQKLDAG